MSTTVDINPEPLLSPADVTAAEVDRVERALIDSSTRLPVLVFYTSAIAWLILSTSSRS